MSSPQLRGPGEVAEDEAGPALAATYARLREALGVGFVPTVYRMLGVHEAYLTAATAAVAELIASESAEEFALEARRMAHLAVSRMPAASIPLGADQDAVDAIFERYNTANPRNLLFARALLPAGPTDPGAVMGPDQGSSPSPPDRELILADVLELHGGFVAPGVWRELAEYPELLARAWPAVRALGSVPAFQEARVSIARLASTVAAEVSAPDPRALGLGPEQVRSVETILTWFSRGITAMIVEIEYLRESGRA
jgi:hypothetical protein